MKKIITFIFGLITIAAYSQIIIPKTSDKGILITQTNEKIEYRNLKYANGKITYVNAENNVLEFLYENSLKSIEEGEQSLHTQVSDIEKLSEKSKEIKLTDKRDIKDFLDKH
ncbi:hypothetical protein [Chryseobacterium echinoideorum]|uniref:hypothetical protein n=1 Tax=Chryseobacterium echinoideorum TaxID=1549648 RepID=UPI0011854E36|nr:hypothetical protein [Chryseobacterium echinoideorum]